MHLLVGSMCTTHFVQYDGAIKLGSNYIIGLDSLLQAAEPSKETDLDTARRYFSGDDYTGWPQSQQHSMQQSAVEGVSSKTIVSGLMANRKQDHAVWLLKAGVCCIMLILILHPSMVCCVGIFDTHGIH